MNEGTHLVVHAQFSFLNGEATIFLADRDLVTRDEFEAVRAMAQKAREENDALKARIAALEAKHAAEE